MLKCHTSKLRIKKRVWSIISASSDYRRMKCSSLEPPRRAALNGGGFILLRLLDAEIFNKTSTIWHLTFTLLRHLPFRWISRHPVVVEGWNYHHSTRLSEAILMSCMLSFYDHCMLWWSTKPFIKITEFWQL